VRRLGGFVIVLGLLASACGARTDLAGGGGGRGRDAGGPPRRDAGPGPIDAGDGEDAAACGAPCDDGVFCNGVERCQPSGECRSFPPPDCDDGDECTVDSCDPRRDMCVGTPVERDDDGDGVSACAGDCDDRDPGRRPGLMEACDGSDQDCDGAIDEGVLSECNDCRPGCHLTTAPDETGGEWRPTEEGSEGVVVEGGDLVLSSTRSESNFAWIANHLFGTITKLDTRTGNQVAEYDSVLNDGTNHAEPAGSRCITSSAGGNCPSRTAVDLNGAVYIANRAFFNQGTVTKIAGLPDDCRDRDGDGVLETSRDMDADGVIERSVPGEFLGQDDECILWTRDVGADGSVPRAIAVAADGTIWVGLHEDQRVLQIDPTDGTVLRNISVGGSMRRFSPYGAAIDSRGRLWLTEAGTGRILEIDTATGAIGVSRTATARDGCSGSYGIAIDGEDRVWLAGFQCSYAFRYDRAADRWMTVSLPGAGAGRGIVADDRGFVYMAASHTFIRITPGVGFEVGDEIARVTRFRADDGGDVTIFGTADDPLPGSGTIGVGLDDDGQVWLINQGSSTAVRLDTDSGDAREYPVGENPYTYSDFTGYALRTFTAPSGYLRQVIEGCPAGPTEWEILTWDADTPGATRVEARVRSASSSAGLPSAPFIGTFTESPSELMLMPGPVPPLRFLEIEIRLIADGSLSPRVRSVTVQYNCP
jgi:sugar lactone lactonase YvrE